MSNSTIETQVGEQKKTNDFLVIGIVLASILLLFGVILYLYTSSLTVDTVQDNIDNTNTNPVSYNY